MTGQSPSFGFDLRGRSWISRRIPLRIAHIIAHRSTGQPRATMAAKSLFMVSHQSTKLGRSRLLHPISGENDCRRRVVRLTLAWAIKLLSIAVDTTSSSCHLLPSPIVAAPEGPPGAGERGSQMSTLLLTLAALACPTSMGAMMWMMMRGNRSEGAATDAATDAASTQAEIAWLQAEVDELRAAETERAHGQRQS